MNSVSTLSFRCCEQATDPQCKYNLNHEVSRVTSDTT